MHIRGKNVPGRQKSKCKGLEGAGKETAAGVAEMSDEE